MQQVNLYVAELRPTQEKLTAVSLLILVVGFCGLMLVGVLINGYQLMNYEKQVLRVENLRASSSKQVAEIKSRTPADTAGKLDKEIAVLRSKIQQRTLISNLIGNQNLGNRTGYAQRFTALAESVPSEVSISKFKFLSGSLQVDLLGESRRADSVAKMIGELKSKPAFSNASFGALTIIESPSYSDRVEFSLGYEPLFDQESSLAERGE